MKVTTNGSDGSIKAFQAALILQGTQNDVLHPNGVLSSADVLDFAASTDAINNMERLAVELRKRGGTVIHSFYINDPGAKGQTKNTPMFRAMRALPAVVRGTWGAQAVGPLTPLNEDLVVEKARMNPFHGSTLGSLLTGLGTTHVIFAGGLTNTGVEAGARHAADEGLHVWVPSDATFSHNLQWHEASIRYNLTKFSDVVTTDRLLASMRNPV